MNTVNPIFGQRTSDPVFQASTEDIEAAKAYERIFVPALFSFWPELLIGSANTRPGDRTLDVACGTGVLTRQLWQAGYRDPAPIGLDISTGMLVVAHQLAPGIQWCHADAMTLPYDDGAFDRVFCQYGLMFFADRLAAIRDMQRVLVREGRLVLAVWDSVDNNPGFQEKIDILDRMAGREAGDALRAPFCLGDRDGLVGMMEEAGVQDVELDTIGADARFNSLGEFVDAELRGWLPVMGVHLSEDLISAIHAECGKRLTHYVNASDGSLTLPMSAHIVAGRPGPGAAGQ